MPKELRSRQHPNFPVQILSDEDYEILVKKGLHKRYVVKDIIPFKPVLDKTPKIVKRNINETRRTEDLK